MAVDNVSYMYFTGYHVLWDQYNLYTFGKRDKVPAACSSLKFVYVHLC